MFDSIFGRGKSTPRPPRAMPTADASPTSSTSASAGERGFSSNEELYTALVSAQSDISLSLSYLTPLSISMLCLLDTHHLNAHTHTDPLSCVLQFMPSELYIDSHLAPHHPLYCLRCSVLNCTVLNCTALNCTALYCNVIYIHHVIYHTYLVHGRVCGAARHGGQACGGHCSARHQLLARTQCS